MILRSAICFSALAAVLLIAAALPVSAATVSGDIRLLNARGAPAAKGDDSGVVVWLTSSVSFKPVVDRHARMLQQHKRFVPHILAIATGTSVDFPNLDPLFHNAFSNFDGTIFDVSLYPPGTSRRVQFDRPGIVRVFCNIHSTMSAVIVVVNSNSFTVTDKSGHYSLDNVGPGRYGMHFFHERATPATLAKLTRELVVNGGDRILDPISISEAGYLPVVHKNKYGRDYPANDDAVDGYGLPLQ